MKSIILRFLYGIATLFIVLFYGCTVAFTPSVQSGDKILVVDAMITNAAENYYVNLSYANPFNSAVQSLPVTGAAVYVKDDLNNSYNFGELGNGKYASTPNQFIAEIGRTYNLYIQTTDGFTYQSAPQFMENTLAFDSIRGELTDQSMLQGSASQGEVQGIANIVNIQRPNGNNTSFRFEDSLMIEYITNGINPNSGITRETVEYYGWYYLGFNTTPLIAGPGSNLENFELFFFPAFNDFYYIPDTQIIYCFVPVIREYAINSDTYNFYNSLIVQLSAQNYLFNPIASQVIGNIKCTNDSTKIVEGRFEASSFLTYTYIIDPNTLSYMPTSYFGNIPAYGSPQMNLPTFWKKLN